MVTSYNDKFLFLSDETETVADDDSAQRFIADVDAFNEDLREELRMNDAYEAESLSYAAMFCTNT